MPLKLKKNWSKLKKIADPRYNFSTYRGALKRAPLPALPYLGRKLIIEKSLTLSSCFSQRHHLYRGR